MCKNIGNILRKLGRLCRDQRKIQVIFASYQCIIIDPPCFTGFCELPQAGMILADVLQIEGKMQLELATSSSSYAIVLLVCHHVGVKSQMYIGNVDFLHFSQATMFLLEQRTARMAPPNSWTIPLSVEKVKLCNWTSV